MPGALMEFSSQQAYVSRGKKNRPEALIAETIQEWLHKGADHVYVFACGDPSLKKVASARNEDVTISEAHSADAWLRGLYSWKSAALPEDEWLEADKALAIIDRYVAALPDTGEPFIWKLLPGTAGDPDVQKEGETMYASSMEEIEKKAGNGRKQGSDNEVEVMADLSFRFSDGDVYHKAVRIDDLHLDADELAFATREDFEKGINALDIALDALARKVDIEGRVALLDSVKKNRGQSE